MRSSWDLKDFVRKTNRQIVLCINLANLLEHIRKLSEKRVSNLEAIF